MKMTTSLDKWIKWRDGSFHFFHVLTESEAGELHLAGELQHFTVPKGTGHFDENGKFIPPVMKNPDNRNLRYVLEMGDEHADALVVLFEEPKESK